MTDATPRRPAALRSREALLAAAHRTLAANPHASLTEVAADAGVGRATLYRHFPTRKHLIDTLVDAWRLDIETAYRGIDSAGTGADAVVAMTAATIGVMYRHRGVWANPDVQDRRHAVTPKATITDRWRVEIARGIADGTIRADLPVEWLMRGAFATVTAAVDGVADGTFTLDDAARFGASIVITGLSDPAQQPARRLQKRRRD